jgi:alpha-glucosidase
VFNSKLRPQSTVALSGLVCVMCLWSRLVPAAEFTEPAEPALSGKLLGDGAEVRDGAVQMRVTAIQDNVLRVRVSPVEHEAEDSSWAVSPAARQHSVSIQPASTAGDSRVVTFNTAELKIRIDTAPLRLNVSDLADHPITTDAPQRAVEVGERGFTLRKVLPAGEHYYALGDKTGPFDHRGQAFVNWNSESYGFQESSDPLYKSIPFFVAAGGPAGSYGVFLDSTWRTWFDFGRREAQTLELASAGGSVDYYVIYGPSVRRVVESYTNLTGRAPLPPLWSLGFQQSRYSYMSSAEVRGIAKRMREERIPADVIWLDIDFQDRNRPFTTNPRTYSDLSSLTADLRRQGLRLVTITDLHIPKAPNQSYAPYDTGVAGDHFVKLVDGSIYSGEVWPGSSVFPEFTQERTRRWWGDLYHDFVAAGVSGFWNDMNEPSVFKTPTLTMPLDVRHRIEAGGTVTRVATHEEIHNVYGMQNSRATFEGLIRLKPDERPFVMTRATYAGGQRYAATWTGDNSATWNHLNLAISTLLNLGMSGFAYSGADVGGFIGDPTPELLTKWIEVATFMPILRIHSAKGTQPREPWVNGPEHTSIRRRFIEERYRLLPYLYALADENSRTGAPLMRPVFFEFPEALTDSCRSPNEFMLGGGILVVPPPHFESNSAYEACLPKGDWFDYWTGLRAHPTAQLRRASQAPAPTTSSARIIEIKPTMEALPVFVRAGTILPRQPLVQSTMEVPQGPLTLDIYPGGNCHGSIYVDDGHGFSYQQGNYLRQEIRCQQTSAGLRVDLDERDGRLQPWWQRMRFRVHDWHGSARVSVNAQAMKGVDASSSGVVEFTIDDLKHPARLSVVHTDADHH